MKKRGGKIETRFARARKNPPARKALTGQFGGPYPYPELETRTASAPGAYTRGLVR